VALVLLSIWERTMQRGYLDAFIEANGAQPLLWSDRSERDRRISILTTESTQVLTGASEFMYRVSASSMNVLFNIVIISVLVERKFAIVYLLSLVVSAFLYRMLLQRQALLASSAQTGRVALTQQLISAWDNVVLGNRYNFGCWKNLLDQLFGSASEKIVGLSRFNQLMSISIAGLTLIPTIGVVFWSASVNHADKASLAALIVILPRLFMILTATHELLSLGSQWNEQRTKLSGILSALEIQANDISSRIQWSKITLMVNDVQVPIASRADLVALVGKVGRLTVRGENGAGKSTLLTLLKEEFGDDAFLLPAHHTLCFGGQISKNVSTGQMLKTCLEEINRSVSSKILLLDEWAANLDSGNRAILSNLIDEMAASRCVIEVRH